MLKQEEIQLLFDELMNRGMLQPHVVIETFSDVVNEVLPPGLPDEKRDRPSN